MSDRKRSKHFKKRFCGYDYIDCDFVKFIYFVDYILV
jgi:hypothetical protein